MRSVGTRWVGWLATVGAFQRRDQQQSQEDEYECVHGSNYALYYFKPRVAYLTWFD